MSSCDVLRARLAQVLPADVPFEVGDDNGMLHCVVTVKGVKYAIAIKHDDEAVGEMQLGEIVGYMVGHVNAV